MVPGLIHSKNFRNQKFRRQQREKKKKRLAQSNDYDQEELEQRRPRSPGPIPKKKIERTVCWRGNYWWFGRKQRAKKKKKKRLAHSNHSDQEEREQRKPSPPRLIPKKKKMDRFWMWGILLLHQKNCSHKKKMKEPCVEEDIIDGFTIMSFKTKDVLVNLWIISKALGNTGSGMFSRCFIVLCSLYYIKSTPLPKLLYKTKTKICTLVRQWIPGWFS